MLNGEATSSLDAVLFCMVVRAHGLFMVMLVRHTRGEFSKYSNIREKPKKTTTTPITYI